MADQYGDKIKRARQAGYSDDEIVGFLAKSDAKVKRAVGEGYDAASIIGHLTKAPAAKKVSWAEDVARSGAQGLGKAATGLAGAFGDARELGLALGAFGSKMLGASPEQIARGQQTTRALSAVRAAPTSGELNQKAGLTYKPQTRSGKFAEAIGQNAPAALVPGSVPARAANVLVPAIVGEGAGQLAEAAGASPGVAAGARIAGSLAGAGLASIRVAPQNAAVANRLGSQNRAAMQQRAAEYRASGIEPALVDVVDESGRGTMRAAAMRQTPARQQVADFAEARVLDLPNRMSGQARNILSSDARNPLEIATDLAKQRRTRADLEFGKVRGDVVDLGDEAMTTFRVPEVADAVADAARRERDPVIRGELARLEQWARSGVAPAQAPKITVGMADRISRVLLGKARDTRDPDLATTLSDFGNAIRTPTKSASEGYKNALAGYAEESALIKAAEQGDDFLTRNTDEFIAATPGPGQPGNELARATARRAIERKSGENVSSAPGVARAIATAPEQQRRNVALLGEQDANRLQAAMGLEERAVRNAVDISPRTGPQSANRLLDAAQTAVGTGRSLLRGDWVGVAMDWLKSRGMSDRQAQALLEASIDPTRTDEVIAQIGQEGVRRLRMIANAATVGALTAPQSQQPQ